MKRRLFLAYLLLYIGLTTSAQFLHEGDTIAILSPSSATDTATINGGIRTLQSWGYPCIVAPHALSDNHGFAGTADERTADLLWALRTPSIKAALLNAEARAGYVGIHGSMCHAINTYQGTDTVSQTLRRMLAGDLPTYRLAPHPLNQMGRAEGILVGGNMSVLHGLAGSDYDPLLLPDIILFVEDTGEGMSKVDRMLHNIEVRGLMSHVRGLIIGQFTSYKHPENGFDDMNAMFHEYLQQYHIPVCYDFPVGHSHLRNFPLLVGSRATLEVTPDGSLLSF